MAKIKQYQTKDGATRYEFRVYAGLDATGRKRYVHRSGFTTQKAATLAASRVTLDTARGGRGIATERMTFEDVYNEWLEGYKNTVRETTLRCRLGDAKVVLPALGSIKLSKLTTAKIQREVNEWAMDTVKSYADRLYLIKRVLRYAVRAGYIPNNPAELVVKPRRRESTDQDRLNFWNREELARFFGAIDQRQAPEAYAYFRLLAFGGLRRGEAEALTWPDISQSDHTVSVTKTKALNKEGRYTVNPTKTKASVRTVSLDPETMAAFRTWHVKQLALLLSKGINGNQPDQLVFPSVIKNTLISTSTPVGWLATYTEKAGLSDHPISMHGFRHSHASALFAAGATIKEVQTRLGHGDAKTTLNVYTHVTKNQGQQASEKLAAYLGF